MESTSRIEILNIEHTSGVKGLSHIHSTHTYIHIHTEHNQSKAKARYGMDGFRILTRASTVSVKSLISIFGKWVLTAKLRISSPLSKKCTARNSNIRCANQAAALPEELSAQEVYALQCSL